MARTLHIHPNVLDFWLVAVYCEFDMRGSMQAARKIMAYVRNIFNLVTGHQKKLKHERILL